MDLWQYLALGQEIWQSTLVMKGMSWTETQLESVYLTHHGMERLQSVAVLLVK